MATTPLVGQNDNRPLSYLTGGIGSGTASSITPSPLGSKLVVAVTATGTLTITCLDNTAPTISLGPGVYQFDVAHQLVSWTGTMQAISFYRY